MSQRWLPTDDALPFLLCRAVIAVYLKGHPISVFTIAIDQRLRTNPTVPGRTVGCFLEYIAMKLPSDR